MIDLFRPYVPEEAKEEVLETLGSKWIAQGPKVEKFERGFSALFRQAYCVSLSSGTAALEVAYELIGLKKGDEVISTPLTCTATNLPLVRRGVKIVWADVLNTTLCIDPLDVHNKITTKTKAIIQVHLGGIRADVGKVHVPVVSDAAQALGVFAGDYSCFSFQAIKHITTGDGGMIVVKDLETYKKAKLLRWFGIDRDTKVPADWTAYRTRMMVFDIELPGNKWQMNDIAAGMGLAGLKHYLKIANHREKIFAIYREGLRGLGGITLVDGKENAHWLVTLLVERRDDFAKMLFEAGIDCNVVQIRNDIYKIFGGKRADLPNLNSLEDKYISLPIGMHVSEEDATYICATIKKGW